MRDARPLSKFRWNIYAGGQISFCWLRAAYVHYPPLEDLSALPGSLSTVWPLSEREKEKDKRGRGKRGWRERGRQTNASSAPSA